jgi:hypothetical protein
MVGSIFQIQKRDEKGIRLQIYGPAVPAIASVRASPRDVFFPPEAHASVSAIPAPYMNFDIINKHDE